MAEGSVAPKERVNIVYKPATGDAQQEVELPLKLLMMGDYTLRADDTPLDDRKTINVDKDNFDEVMRNQALHLTFSVPNRLAESAGEGEEEGASQELAVDIGFKSMRDFEPEHVVQKVPELNKLLELRQALTALKGPLGNVPAFRRQIQDLLKDESMRARLLEELKLGESEGE